MKALALFFFIGEHTACFAETVLFAPFSIFSLPGSHELRRRVLDHLLIVLVSADHVRSLPFWPLEELVA